MANTVIVNVEANTAAATANITTTTVAVDNLTKAEQKLNQESKKVASGFEDVTKNGGAIAILDQLTGGLASRVRDTFEATKLFNFSLKGMRTALIATGIGAFIVALGLVVAYWDEIVEIITGANKSLQLQIDLKNEYIEGLDHELTVLKAQQDLAKAQGGYNKELAAQQRAKLKDLLTERRLAVELAELNVANLRHGDYEKYVEAVDKFEKAKLDVIKTEIALQNSWNEVTERAKAKREKQAADEKLLSETRKKANADALAQEQESAQEIEQIRAAQVNTQKEARAEELLQNKLKYEKLLEIAKNYYEEDSEQIQGLRETQQELETALTLKHADEDAETQKIIDDKIQADKDAKAIIEKEKQDKILKDKADLRAKEIQEEIEKNNVIAAARQNLQNIIQGLEASGLAKTKAGQILYKALALTQIGIDSAIAISKASTLANAEGLAAQLAFPFVPGIGTVARVLSYGSTVLQVASNMAKAKSILSGGGSVGGVQTSTPPVISAPPEIQQPAFNIVGQGAGSQIASALGEQQNIPVQAYVVSQDITTAQSLENGIIQGATLGG
tara:strand:- start:25 stop:1707 length:1683 start_codon:yes stop_codon:yes gene_type:complete